MRSSLTALTAAAATLFAGSFRPVTGQQTPPRPCPADSAANTGIVAGIVIDAETGVPLRDAEVKLSWRAQGDRRNEELETRTDSLGAFVFCDAPAGERAMLRSEFMGKSSRAEAVTIAAGAYARAKLKLDAPHSNIIGRVLEFGSGRPVPSASVRLRNTPLQQITPDDGRFAFPQVPPGQYRIDVEHMGYVSVGDTLALDFGTSMDVTVRLAPHTIALRPLVVTVRSNHLERAGFYARQQRGIGSYITRAEIDSMAPLLTSDLLRGMTGVQLVRRRTGGYAAVGRGNCSYRYILDGTRVGPGFDMDDIAPEWIEAIEIYRGPATVPVEFAPFAADGGSNCGVIVVWTRTRF